MRRKLVGYLSGLVILLGIWDSSASQVDPSTIFSISDIHNLPPFQAELKFDPRSRLSTSQQREILSDVQQHQHNQNLSQQDRFVEFPGQFKSQEPTGTTSYPSLLKYRVNRNKQQLDKPFIHPAFAQHDVSQSQSTFINNFGGFQDSGFFHNDQFRTLLETQRELELLRNQREQLLLEHEKLRRQQELLLLQNLRQLSSTTQAPFLTSPATPRITPGDSELFLNAIAAHQSKYTSTTTKPTTTTTTAATTTVKAPVSPKTENSREIPKDILSLLQAQNIRGLGNNSTEIRTIYQTEKTSGSTSAEKDKLSKQLKLALAENSDKSSKNIITRDLVLPNGKKLQIIQTSNGLPSIATKQGSSQLQTVTDALDFPGSATPTVTPATTTVTPAKAIFKEVTDEILPPGAGYEVFRQKNDGKVEDIEKSMIQGQLNKKVTFVVLEEQTDGSYKVRGVKSNAEKNDSADVKSIVEKIKKGEINLPPLKDSVKAESKTSSTTVTTTTERIPITIGGLKYRDADTSTSNPLFVSIGNSQSDNYVTSGSTPFSKIYSSSKGFESTTPAFKPTPYRTTQSPVFLPTSHSYYSMNNVRSVAENINADAVNYKGGVALDNSITSGNEKKNNEPPFEYSSNQYSRDTIASLLRAEGFFAMAKYLSQSGLNTVLNETGPYTIFVPTDKAFKSLLIHLGGPEKAEQKFRENPRLLSGLLLHHAIPGAFKVESLQDEMTGVSLAGTQLRVNVYDMHNHEWNNDKVTTVNGAKISVNKRDIQLPQGIAHGVDRVMFPLPIGDLTQTLAVDREQRFSTFLRMLHASGLEKTLSGSRTYTIFAPTDAAFASAAAQDDKLVSSNSDILDNVKEIISRHIMPSTLYTAGMRYYHQKDTLQPHFTLKIQKNGGRVRVNEANVITRNIPATNGVIHAIDSIL